MEDPTKEQREREAAEHFPAMAGALAKAREDLARAYEQNTELRERLALWEAGVLGRAAEGLPPGHVVRIPEAENTGRIERAVIKGTRELVGGVGMLLLVGLLGLVLTGVLGGLALNKLDAMTRKIESARVSHP